ncbi:MAG: type II secretion system protein GspE, partial [candidate division Zixibacteria bacterium SM23_81]
DIIDEDLELIQEDGEETPDIQELKSAVQEAPLVKLVNGIISDAIRKGASDIHIESHERLLRVRYRVDGTLIDMPPLPYRLKAAIVSRIKIMAELDIAERRVPQDGRIKVKIGKKTVDIRVSSLPAIFGEKIVMRILDPSNLMLDLANLGLGQDAIAELKAAIQKPYGIVLVTGPTGSGKTTTLYSALNLLNQPGVNIMTAEDPVEYHLEGINQVQVRPEIKLTFAAALRAFLRQDPDIIMVGEIRDLETAEISIRAALTGHLVLSTVHTNDAAGTITRLVDMGIPPFLVSSALNLIVAQRLVRKICSQCKRKDAKTHELHKLLQQLGLSPEEAEGLDTYHGAGCSECHHTGFSGRIGLYEVLPVSSKLRNLIVGGASAQQLRQYAAAENVATLRDTAMEKLAEGLTTVEEVMRETVSN